MSLGNVFNRKSGVLSPYILALGMVFSGGFLSHSVSADMTPQQKYQSYISMDLAELTDKYETAVYELKEKDVINLERSFVARGLEKDIIQNIRNNALLYCARVFPRHNIDLALKYGAEIYAENDKGQGVGELILSAKIGQFKELVRLYEERNYDLQFLADKPEILWQFFARVDFAKEKEVVEALRLLDKIGIDLLTIEEPATGINLRDAAEKNNAKKVLKLLKDMKKHSLSDSMVSFDENTYRSYLEFSGAPVIDRAEPKNYKTKFGMYSKITYDTKIIPDNYRDSVLFVAEEPTLFSKGTGHVEKTSYVAYTTAVSLGAKDLSPSVNVIGLHQKPGSRDDNVLTALLKYGYSDNYQVVSVSMSNQEHDDYLKYYKTDSGVYSQKLLAETDENPSVFYKSSGNVGDDTCITVDNINFCVQDDSEVFHHYNSVFIGAAHKKRNGTMVIEDYSNPYPTFCGLLPYEEITSRYTSFYSGTSFSAPASASVEKHLANIFARSAAFPEGLVHEDIMMAMSLTAETRGLIDEKTNKVTPVFKNIAGITMTSRCGYGVVQPQKAADLLTKMVEWTRNDDDVAPTKTQAMKFEIDNKKVRVENGRYIYSVTALQDGIITNIRAGTPFDDGKRGASLLKIGDSNPVPLNISHRGLTTAFHFAGKEVRTGDIIQIITTKPMRDADYWGRGKPFLELYTVGLKSPIKKAITYAKKHYR